MTMRPETPAYRSYTDIAKYSALIILSFIFAAMVWRSNNPVGPDSCHYIIGADSIYSGRGFLDVAWKPQTVCPPGYPLVVGALAKVIGNTALAGRLVALFAGTFAVIPLVLLSRRFFGDATGWVTGLLFILMPQRIIWSNYILADTLFLFLVLWAVWLWVREAEDPSIGRSIVIGVLLGFSFLVQHWGLSAAGMLIIFSFAKRHWNVPKLRSTAIYSLIFMAFVLSYVIYLHAHMGIWTFSGKVIWNGAHIALSKGVPYEKLVLLNEDASKIVFLKQTESRVEFTKRYLQNAKQEMHLLKTMLGGLLCVCLALGFAAELHRKNKALICAFPTLVIIAIPLLLAPAYHVEDRYVFLGGISFLMLATWILSSRFGSKWSQSDVSQPGKLALLVPVMMVAALFIRQDLQLAKSHPQPTLVPQISSWINSNLPPESPIMLTSVYAEVGVITNRPRHGFPYETIDRTLTFAKKQGVQYIFVIDNQLLSPEWKHFMDAKQTDPRLKYIRRWENSSGHWVVVYRIA